MTLLTLEVAVDVSHYQLGYVCGVTSVGEGGRGGRGVFPGCRDPHLVYWRLKAFSRAETEELGFPRGEQNSLGVGRRVLGPLLGSVTSCRGQEISGL